MKMTRRELLKSLLAGAALATPVGQALASVVPDNPDEIVKVRDDGWTHIIVQVEGNDAEMWVNGERVGKVKPEHLRVGKQITISGDQFGSIRIFDQPIKQEDIAVLAKESEPAERFVKKTAAAIKEQVISVGGLELSIPTVEDPKSISFWTKVNV